ncbi:MAG: superoxide dismutase [Gammaproteobacteria bacterium]
MKKMFSTLLPVALVVLALPVQSINAADKPFPTRVYTQDGSPPEGFTIGKGHTAYQGSLDGSVYKADLRSGKGELLVDVIEPWTPATCRLLGLRVDRRTNYLFGAGCFYGNAFVYDADTGALVAEYQLDSSGASVINDLAITNDAVYFTDFNQPFLYKLPLSKNGGLPAADAAIAIPLTGDFPTTNDFGEGTSNGIVATPDGKTLIIGSSFTAKLYKVDPETGDAKEIIIDTPLDGFLDGIAMQGRTLYIATPYEFEPGSVDRIQVVELDKDLLSGKLVNTITDDDLDGVASLAIFGGSLYVNNARYFDFPMSDTPYWVTKLNIR